MMSKLLLFIALIFIQKVSSQVTGPLDGLSNDQEDPSHSIYMREKIRKKEFPKSSESIEDKPQEAKFLAKKELIDNRNKILPSLQIILNVHPYNKFNELPFVLSGIEKQIYPKSRINVLIQTEIYQFNDRSTKQVKYNDLTIRLLKSWKKNLELKYHKFELKLVGSDEEEVEYWSTNRYKKMMEYKSFGFEYALNEWADYCLFFDADVILTNSNTFNDLIINQTNVIFSPMLLSLGTYSNFWAGVNENGYYKRTEDYIPILERQKIGKFEVPMIHTFIFIDLRIEKARNLKFRFQDLEQIEEFQEQLDLTPFDDIIVFAKSAQLLNFSFYLDNNNVYGFVMPSIDKINLIEQEENLIALELECLIETEERFKLSNNLQQYHYPISEDLINLISNKIDKIYVINLERRIERKEYMQSTCDILGLKCEFTLAVDGKKIDEMYMTENHIQVMKNYRDPFHQRPLTHGEIGCFMSHFNIWMNILKYNFTWVMVLEDDVRFERNFHQRFNAMFESIQDLSDEIDLVYLGRKREGRASDETWFNQFTVRPTYSYWTIGYLISLNGAKKLIESSPLDKMLPVDEFLPIMYDRHPNTNWSNHFAHRNLSALAVHPILIQPLHYVGDDQYVSDTEDSKKLILHEEL